MIHVLSHANYVNMTSQEFFKIYFYSSTVEKIRLHFHTHIYIATLMLFIPCKRAEQKHRTNAVIITKIFAGRFQLFYCTCSI